MRKSRQETAETRAHIVTTAAKEFAEKGIGTTGLADVMSAAGLTQGGFYRHFNSKDQLVAEAFVHSLNQTLANLKGKSLKKIAADYLAREHRDTFEVTCPYAAMGSELQRGDNDTRRAASDGVSRFIEVIAESLTNLPNRQRGPKAHAIVSSLVGGLLLSRVVEDPKLSEDILKNTKKHVSQQTSTR